MKRTQVLKRIEQEHEKLLETMRDIPDDVVATQPIAGEWTLKDMMGHLAMWYRFAVLRFVDETIQRGVPRPSGLNDVTVNDYNERELQLRRDWTLGQVRAEFDAAYEALLASVEKLSDEQLNAPLPAPWEKDVTLERLIAWNSYEHEPEHLAQIEAWRKVSITTRPAKKSQPRKMAKTTARKHGKTSVRRAHR